jgi:hypothetical protein
MQQLLDKWERLRTSEYLRPDEKLMLNHCISDLKRFTDHSVDVNEMVGKQQTAVEWLISQQKHNQFFDIETIEQAKEMEKERIKDAFIEGANTIYAIPKTFDEWYNETYGGNK